MNNYQKARLKFFLDYSRDEGDYWAVVEQTKITNLSAEQELILFGDLTTGTHGRIDLENMPDIIAISGVPVATPDSVMGRLEVAWFKLTLQEESMYVKKAGSVELNAAEGMYRRKYFQERLEELYQLIGKPSSTQRVGW